MIHCLAHRSYPAASTPNKSRPNTLSQQLLGHLNQRARTRIRIPRTVKLHRAIALESTLLQRSNARAISTSTGLPASFNSSPLRGRSNTRADTSPQIPCTHTRRLDARVNSQSLARCGATDFRLSRRVSRGKTGLRSPGCHSPG